MAKEGALKEALGKQVKLLDVRCDGYHGLLMQSLVEVIKAQANDGSERARRDAVEKIVVAAASKLMTNKEGK